MDHANHGPRCTDLQQQAPPIDLAEFRAWKRDRNSTPLRMLTNFGRGVPHFAHGASSCSLFGDRGGRDPLLPTAGDLRIHLKKKQLFSGPRGTMIEDYHAEQDTIAPIVPNGSAKPGIFPRTAALTFEKAFHHFCASTAHTVIAHGVSSRGTIRGKKGRSALRRRDFTSLFPRRAEGSESRRERTGPPSARIEPSSSRRIAPCSQMKLFLRRKAANTPGSLTVTSCSDSDTDDPDYAVTK